MQTLGSFPVSDPVALRAYGVIRECGPVVRDLLEARSLERLRGVTHEDDLHDTNEPRSVITDVDLRVHEAVVRAFAGEPVDIVAEEGMVRNESADYRIVLDDLDGTYNASCGVLGRSAISIAVDRHKEPLFGFWHNPYLDEDVFCQLGRGVWYRRRQHSFQLKRFPGPSSLNKARIIIGSTGTTDDPRAEIFNLPLRGIAASSLAPLNYESSVVSLMDVVLGRAEGFVIAGNKAWDLWAARSILSELGIQYRFFTPCWENERDPRAVSNFDPENHLFGFMCATNKILFNKMRFFIKGY